MWTTGAIGLGLVASLAGEGRGVWEWVRVMVELFMELFLVGVGQDLFCYFAAAGPNDLRFPILRLGASRRQRCKNLLAGDHGMDGSKSRRVCGDVRASSAVRLWDEQVLWHASRASDCSRLRVFTPAPWVESDRNSMASPKIGGSPEAPVAAPPPAPSHTGKPAETTSPASAALPAGPSGWRRILVIAAIVVGVLAAGVFRGAGDHFGLQHDLDRRRLRERPRDVRRAARAGQVLEGAGRRQQPREEGRPAGAARSGAVPDHGRDQAGGRGGGRGEPGGGQRAGAGGSSARRGRIATTSSTRSSK